MSDPTCQECGHLGSYHDMPKRAHCIGKVGAPVDLGTKACPCLLRADEIAGWREFKEGAS